MASADRAAIRRLLGDVEITPLGAGLDHRAYAVGDRLVARCGARVEQEAKLLETIAPQLPLPVPEPVIVGHGAIIQRRMGGILAGKVGAGIRSPGRVTYLDDTLLAGGSQSRT